MLSHNPIIDEDQIGGLADAAGAAAVRAIMEAFWSTTEELSAELNQAILTADQDAVKKLGHALKGSAANVGAARMADRAKAIEIAAAEGDVDAARAALQAFSSDIEETRAAISALLDRAS